MMNFERITNPLHPMYRRALELYQISFPLHEQREELSQTAILHDDTYHFELIYDEDIFIGLVLYWENLDYIYIEHFCILPEMRNKQYGKKVLSFLKEQKKTLILEIDPPIDEVSVRRKGFYERCGFVENPYPHIHPPYHQGNHGHELVIMSSPMAISQAEYNAFDTHLQDKIMNKAFL